MTSTPAHGISGEKPPPDRGEHRDQAPCHDGLRKAPGNQRPPVIDRRREPLPPQRAGPPDRPDHELGRDHHEFYGEDRPEEPSVSAGAVVPALPRHVRCLDPVTGEANQHHRLHQEAGTCSCHPQDVSNGAAHMSPVCLHPCRVVGRPTSTGQNRTLIHL